MKTTIACIAVLLFSAAAEANSHGLFQRLKANRQARMAAGCAGTSAGCHGATYVLPPVRVVLPPPQIVVPPPQVHYAPAQVHAPEACGPAERRRGLFGRRR